MLGLGEASTRVRRKKTLGLRGGALGLEDTLGLARGSFCVRRKEDIRLGGSSGIGGSSEIERVMLWI